MPCAGAMRQKRSISNRKIPADTVALEDSLVLSPSSFVATVPVSLSSTTRHARATPAPRLGQRQVGGRLAFHRLRRPHQVTEAEIDTFIARIARTRRRHAESLASYRGMMTGHVAERRLQASGTAMDGAAGYIALGNLLTSAALLGVDACPMEGFVPAEFDQVLGLPAQGLAAVVCCALGYRSIEDKYARHAEGPSPKADLLKAV